MIKYMENKNDNPVREYIIIYYKDLLSAAVNREDYETAAKYKKWIENLEKIKSDEK